MGMEGADMTSEQARGYFERYRPQIEGLTEVMFDIADRGDVDAFDWLVQCFLLTATLTKNHIQAIHQNEFSDLVRHEPLH